MAQTRRLAVGSYYILSRLTTASPEEWTVIACLTSKSFKSPTKVIDVTSDCGPDTLAGFAAQTVDVAGFCDFDSSDSESGGELYNLQQAPTNSLSPAYTWKIEPETPIAGDYTLTFDGNISNYQWDANTDNPVSFTATLGVQGTVTLMIES
jgi:hypothetical protein